MVQQGKSSQFFLRFCKLAPQKYVWTLFSVDDYCWVERQKLFLNCFISLLEWEKKPLKNRSNLRSVKQIHWIDIIQIYTGGSVWAVAQRENQCAWQAKRSQSCSANLWVTEKRQNNKHIFPELQSTSQFHTSIMTSVPSTPVTHLKMAITTSNGISLCVGSSNQPFITFICIFSTKKILSSSPVLQMLTENSCHLYGHVFYSLFTTDSIITFPFYPLLELLQQ